MDEGAGNTVTDATGHGHNGSFVGSPAWVGSTAYLGDGSVHLRAATDVLFIQRSFAINGAHQASGFRLGANVTFWRFHDFGNAPPNAAVAFEISAGLQTAAGTPIATKPGTYSNAFSFAAYNASSPPGSGFAGGLATINESLTVEPANGVQMDSVNNTHQMTATLRHSENGGAFVNDGTEATQVARLLHFNGRVLRERGNRADERDQCPCQRNDHRSDAPGVATADRAQRPLPGRRAGIHIRRRRGV